MTSFVTNNNSPKLQAAWRYRKTLTPQVADPWLPVFFPSSFLASSTISLEQSQTSVPLATEVRNGFVIPAAKEPSKKIEIFSLAFYAACTFGRILSCGLTHTAINPLDVVKCNMQLAKYRSVSSGFGVLLKKQGAKGLFKGWGPTLLGYRDRGDLAATLTVVNGGDLPVTY